MSVRLQRVLLHDVGPFDDLELVLPEGRDPSRADVHLLVGPNGTGKSTTLQSIAYAASGLARSEFEGRCRSERSLVSASFDGAEAVAARTDRIRGLVADDPASYAVMYYGAARSVPDVSLRGVQDQTTDPFRDRKASELVQWIANSIALEAVAASTGASERAMRHRQAREAVERAIGDVLGRSLTFRLEEPFRVVARLGGVDVPVGQLPDGLQSLLSWVGDLLMRMDRVRWQGDVPVTERPFLLLLDEVEVHLHPAWQRRVLPMVEKLFPKAQIIVSTHSPFVVNSASDAWIHRFRLDEKGRATVEPPLPSAAGESYAAVLEDILGLSAEFDVETEQHLSTFRDLRNRRLKGEAVDALLKDEATWLRQRSPEVANIVEAEMRQLRRQLGQTA